MRGDQFYETADRFGTIIAERIGLTRLQIRAFPARRHDEAGWVIGEKVDGELLAEQLTMAVPSQSLGVPDEYVNSFIASLIRTNPIISARMRSASGVLWPPVFLERAGLHMRFVLWPSEHDIRCDVLLGRGPFS